MGTIRVVDVIDQASYMLTDVGAVRWTKQKLLVWFNEAQRALVSRRPDTLAVNESFKCAAGVKQRIPDIGVQLIDVVRNTDGRNITQVERRLLDAHVPDWSAEQASKSVQHFTFDSRDPKTFYVYPPALEEGAEPGTEIEIVYSKAPTQVSISNNDWDSDSTTIEVDDVWANALQEYILYRAWIKDAENAGNMGRAEAHLQSFRMMIGDITQADMAVSAVDK